MIVHVLRCPENLFTYLLNLEVLVPTTNIATTIRPSMLPIGAPRPAVGVPVRSDESTQPFHPTRLKVPFVGRPRWPREFSLSLRFATSPLAFVHAPVRPQVLPRFVWCVLWQSPMYAVAHSDGGFVAYDFCWSEFSPCSNLGWWGGLKVWSRGFSDRKSLRCAGLMVLWVFCSNLGGSCVWFSRFVLVCSGFDFLVFLYLIFWVCAWNFWVWCWWG